MIRRKRVSLTLCAACALGALAAAPPPEPRPPASAADVPARDTLHRLTPAQALLDSMRRVERLAPRPVLPPPVEAPVDTTNGPAVSAELPGFWRTRAERTAWRQTADYDETMRYCRQLEGGSRWIKLVTYGTSGQGRPLPMLIVSKDRAFTPAAARATHKPVVLIQNGIHAGEIEGKDASLALVRDMAALRTREDLLDSCIVLVLPIFSVDGHERHSPYNRINQNGPEEMGWRDTPIGLNLNRDYVKAETPEMRALIGSVYTTWWPDLLVDDHTTDGADYQHDVTYGFAHGPGVPPSLERWLTEAFEGRVVPRLAQLGHLPAPYLSFRGADPRSGIDFGNTPARLSTGYTILQCRPSILVETHMLKPYGVRVRATYDLLAALLEELRARPGELTRAVAEAETSVIARAAAPDSAGLRNVVLSSHTTNHAVPFHYRGKVAVWTKSDITGSLVPHYTSAPWDTIVPLYREMAADLVVEQPAGYLIPQEWDDVVDLLRLHGVAVRRFVQSWGDIVEVPHITDWHDDGELNEGHHMIRVGKVKLERRRRDYRAGDWWVPLDQRSGALAVTMLEAQSPEGLLAWNFFDTIFMHKEYGEDYVVEPIARAMLASDPALAKEFAAKLAADSSFARSPAARVDFFYRRSPWADPEQDLDPVARALAAPPKPPWRPSRERRPSPLAPDTCPLRGRRFPVPDLTPWQPVDLAPSDFDNHKALSLLH